jgi:hypothetical protein
MSEAHPEHGASLTHDEVVRICGDIEDWKIGAIVSSGASYAELEEAVAWSLGEDDVMGEERKPLTGRVAQVYEILARDEEDEEVRPHGG